MSKPEKCTIASIQSPKLRVEAQFNPKEVSIDKNVPWNKHKNPKGDVPQLEFTNAENRTLSLELFFDAYEGKGASVVAQVEELTNMTKIRPDQDKDKEKHPPLVMVSWGSNFPSFTGVIESLGIKYTMFREDGTPVRATCTLKIKETDEVEKKPETNNP
jgi:hypothetical protein